MPIKLKKSEVSVTCNELVEYNADSEVPATAASDKYSFYKSGGNYKIFEKKFEEKNNADEIKINKTNKKLSAKKFIEDGQKLRPLKAIIPEFEIRNKDIYMKESSIHLYRSYGVDVKDLIVGILVKHATFSRGKYKKSTTKRKLSSKKWNSAHRTWKNIREANYTGRSPYQMGYQHSGAQFRKHRKSIKERKRYLLLTRPQKYFYEKDSFSYLTIGDDGQVLFTAGNRRYNAISYFQFHKISMEDYGGKKPDRPKHTWLRYGFIIKTRELGTLQSSELFTVYYNSNREMRTISI